MSAAVRIPARVAVLGAGGVGGYFGGRLAEAGADVSFIARGAHLKAIQDQGLRVESISGDFHVADLVATDDPSTLPQMDLILVAVKTWQLDQAMEQIKPIVGAPTILLPLLNGVEAADQLARTFGRDQVVGGLCGLISQLAGPGRVRHYGADPMIKFGELDNRSTERIKAIAVLFSRAAGVTAQIATDIHAELWAKFLFISSFSGVGAVTRSPAGVLRRFVPTRDMLEACMREVLAVAQARAVALDQTAIGRALAFLDSLPEDATASMQRDIMGARPSELEAQTGAVVRLGDAAQVATPVNDFIYAALGPMELAARAESGLS